MYVFRITTLFSVLLCVCVFTGCRQQQKDKEIEESATLFSNYFFNWHLHKALDYCTPEAKAQIIFLASNLNQEDIDKLHNSAVAHAAITDIRHHANDSTATAFFTVAHFLQMNEPGKPLETVDKAAFSVRMIRLNGKWKAQLSTLRKE